MIRAMMGFSRAAKARPLTLAEQKYRLSKGLSPQPSYMAGPIGWALLGLVLGIYAIGMGNALLTQDKTASGSQPAATTSQPSTGTATQAP